MLPASFSDLFDSYPSGQGFVRLDRLSQATEICNLLQQIGHPGAGVPGKHNKTKHPIAIDVWT